MEFSKSESNDKMVELIVRSLEKQMEQERGCMIIERSIKRGIKNGLIYDDFMDRCSGISVRVRTFHGRGKFKKLLMGVYDRRGGTGCLRIWFCKFLVQSEGIDPKSNEIYLYKWVKQRKEAVISDPRIHDIFKGLCSRYFVENLL